MCRHNYYLYNNIENKGPRGYGSTFDPPRCSSAAPPLQSFVWIGPRMRLCIIHNKHTYKQTYINTYRQTDIHTNKHTNRQTERYADIHYHRHTNMQTDRHTYIHTDRQIKSHFDLWIRCTLSLSLSLSCFMCPLSTPPLSLSLPSLSLSLLVVSCVPPLLLLLSLSLFVVSCVS